jgi:mannosyltransferase OCH1-like enzyme
MNDLIVHQIVLSDNDILEIDLPNEMNSIYKYGSENVSHKVWHNSLIRSFLSKNFSEDVLVAYDSIKPYAYKSDIARYCILYVYGGWYMDIRNRFVSEIPFIPYLDLIMFYDIPEIGNNAIQNGLIYAKPNNEILKRAILECVSNVSKQHYGDTWHWPTGPVVLGRALKEYGENKKHSLGHFVPNDEESFDFILEDGSIIAKYKNKYQGGMVGIKGSNNYAEMWSERDIY